VTKNHAPHHNLCGFHVQADENNPLGFKCMREMIESFSFAQLTISVFLEREIYLLNSA
jgi:hypothetical protein